MGLKRKRRQKDTPVDISNDIQAIALDENNRQPYDYESVIICAGLAGRFPLLFDYRLQLICRIIIRPAIMESEFCLTKLEAGERTDMFSQILKIYGKWYGKEYRKGR